jgi:hypothetical protein
MENLTINDMPLGVEIYTDGCGVCGEQFCDENPCCCSDRSTEDGLLHENGICRECCSCKTRRFRNLNDRTNNDAI